MEQPKYTKNVKDLLSNFNIPLYPSVCSQPVTAATLKLGSMKYMVKAKVKQSRYRPGVAQRVPGS
jgi:hypothetical protein